VFVVWLVVVLAGYVVLVVDVEVLFEVVFVAEVVVVLLVAGVVVVVFVAGVVVVFDVGTVVVFAVGVFVDVKSVLEIQSVSTVMAPIA
jgi:hypothetical protein